MRSIRITGPIWFLILVLTFEICNVTSLGSAEGQLTLTPSATPKGRIAYFSQQTAKNTSVLNVVDVDGSNPQIYHAGCSNWPGYWSPDGKIYAFFEAANAEPCSGKLRKVHIFNAEDKSVRTIENTHSLFPSPLFWSLDSKQLAFVAGLEDGEQLFVVNPDGSGLRQLTNDRLNKQAFMAAWSPDGKQLAYVTILDSGTAFYTIKSDGTDPHQLANSTISGQVSSDFSWLDNQRIIFSTHHGTSWSIYTVNVNSYELAKLSANNEDDRENAGNLSVSPYGNYVAYILYGKDKQKLCIVEASGRNNRCFEKGMENLVLVWANRVPFSYLRPAWSPDEKYLAFGAWNWAETSPTYHIYIIDIEGANLHRLTANDNAKMELDPVWLP